MDLSCPISAERINENVVRIIAFMVAVIALLCMIFSNYWAIFFLIFDFGMRAFTSGKLSPLKFISIKLNHAFSLKAKVTDQAPKKFAATLGFGFCLLIAVMFILNLLMGALVLTILMTVFALLESLLAICVGCYFYTFLQVFRKSKT